MVVFYVILVFLLPMNIKSLSYSENDCTAFLKRKKSCFIINIEQGGGTMIDTIKQKNTMGGILSFLLIFLIFIIVILTVKQTRRAGDNIEHSFF